MLVRGKAQSLLEELISKGYLDKGSSKEIEKDIYLYLEEMNSEELISEEKIFQDFQERPLADL